MSSFSLILEPAEPATSNAIPSRDRLALLVKNLLPRSGLRVVEVRDEAGHRVDPDRLISPDHATDLCEMTTP